MTAASDAGEYARLSYLFGAGKNGIEVSEVHGVLTGLVCARAVPGTTEMLLELIAERGQLDEVEFVDGLLRDMIEAIHGRLHEDGFEFEPLLPDDEADLRQRTEELARWCGGFVLGLSRAEEEHGAQARGAESEEALRDIMAISEMRHDHHQDNDEDDENEEESELAYSQVHDHVKLGVQIIFEDTPTTPFEHHEHYE